METTGLACRLVISGLTVLVVELDMVECVGAGVGNVVGEGPEHILSRRQVIFCSS